MTQDITFARVEVVERYPNAEHPFPIVPTEVRINGQQVHTSADHPITVEINKDSLVVVNVPLIVDSFVTEAREPLTEAIQTPLFDAATLFVKELDADTGESTNAPR